MNRKDLETLGLNAEQLDAVMKLNGQDIEREKTKTADYDAIKEQLATAKKTIEGFGDVDAIKADVEKYKQAAAQAEADAAAKVAALEIQSKVKDFTGSKKFVNDFTRDAINSKLIAALDDATNKGKGLDEIFTAIIGDNKDILVDENKPTPPKVTEMGGKGGNESGLLAAFKKLNPDINIGE